MFSVLTQLFSLEEAPSLQWRTSGTRPDWEPVFLKEHYAFVGCWGLNVMLIDLFVYICGPQMREGPREEPRCWKWVTESDP